MTPAMTISHDALKNAAAHITVTGMTGKSSTMQEALQPTFDRPVGILGSAITGVDELGGESSYLDVAGARSHDAGCEVT